jgi:hypothetical protein
MKDSVVQLSRCTSEEMTLLVLPGVSLNATVRRCIILCRKIKRCIEFCHSFSPFVVVMSLPYGTCFRSRCLLNVR